MWLPTPVAEVTSGLLDIAPPFSEAPHARGPDDGSGARVSIELGKIDAAPSAAGAAGFGGERGDVPRCFVMAVKGPGDSLGLVGLEASPAPSGAHAGGSVSPTSPTTEAAEVAARDGDCPTSQQQQGPLQRHQKPPPIWRASVRAAVTSSSEVDLGLAAASAASAAAPLRTPGGAQAHFPSAGSSHTSTAGGGSGGVVLLRAKVSGLQQLVMEHPELASAVRNIAVQQDTDLKVWTRWSVWTLLDTFIVWKPLCSLFPADLVHIFCMAAYMAAASAGEI